MAVKYCSCVIGAVIQSPDFNDHRRCVAMRWNFTQATQQIELLNKLNYFRVTLYTLHTLHHVSLRVWNSDQMCLLNVQGHSDSTKSTNIVGQFKEIAHALSSNLFRVKLGVKSRTEALLVS